MNAKCGLDLYQLSMNAKLSKHTMVIGIDAVKNGRISIVGMTASYNQALTKYFSNIDYHNIDESMIKKGFTKESQEMKQVTELKFQIEDFVSAAINSYADHNSGCAPENIVIYRDGIGGPSFKDKVIENEVKYIEESIKKFNKGYNPGLLYVLLDTNMSLRLFETHSSNQVINPGPGTVVDQGIVAQDGSTLFDFYMIANNNPHTATAKPVHYQVVLNSLSLTKQEIEEFTYHQCYNYFGFSGPIKVPACVKYAQKLANYTNDLGFCAKNLQKKPNGKKDKLFYLWLNFWRGKGTLLDEILLNLNRF